MIILEYLIVIASINKHFIPIDCNRMEGTAIWHDFLTVCSLKP